MYKKYIYRDNEIIYSIVIPVYNQESIFVDNVKSIINHTIESFEIIIILDYCFDNTEKNLIQFLENYENDNIYLNKITIYKNNEKPLFETKCDNIGFKNSVGKYCLEIQADMKMTELGYNLQLSKPFEKYNDVIAVSGRCAHQLFDHNNGIGKLGRDIEKSIQILNVCKNKFYVYETCNRGPLLFDRKKLEEMNFLNEEEYFLDDSDHDLMARSYIEKKYICGYVPIDFYSPIVFGSTRNVNTYNHCHEYIVNQNEKALLKMKCNNMLGLKKYQSSWKTREPIILEI